MVIFHSYVSLLEGIICVCWQYHVNYTVTPMIQRPWMCKFRAGNSRKKPWHLNSSWLYPVYPTMFAINAFFWDFWVRPNQLAEIWVKVFKGVWTSNCWWFIHISIQESLMCWLCNPHYPIVIPVYTVSHYYVPLFMVQLLFHSWGLDPIFFHYCWCLDISWRPIDICIPFMQKKTTLWSFNIAIEHGHL